MKSLRQIIKEEIDKSFDWVGDILDQTSLGECLRNKQIHVGDNVLIKGQIHNIHCGYISLPEDGVRVRINRIENTYTNIKVTFIDRLPTQCTFGDFIPGNETLITNDSCGNTLFIEHVKNINESDELDWLKDIANNEKHTVRFYVENNLLTEKGQIYKVSGEYYDAVDEKLYDIPSEFKAEIKMLTPGWYGLMIIPLENVRIITGNEYVHYRPGEIYPITNYEYDKVYLEPVLNESTNDFDWLKSMAKNDTIDFYNKYDLLKPNKKYQLSGSYWDSGEDGDILKHLPDEGVNVEFKTQEDNWFIFKILDDFVMDSRYHHKGDFLYLEDNETKEIYIKPLEDTINENDDFDWVKDIKPAINWNNIKPEDLINRDFILIDRNRLYTIKGYNTSTGHFNIHNHETGKEHRLSLSEIDGLMFMGDIEFVI